MLTIEEGRGGVRSRKTGSESGTERAKRALTGLVAGGMTLVGIFTLPLLVFSERFNLPAIPPGVLYLAGVFTVIQAVAFLVSRFPGNLVPSTILVSGSLIAVPVMMSLQMEHAPEFVAPALMFAAIPVLLAAAVLGTKGALWGALLSAAGIGIVAPWALLRKLDMALIGPVVMLAIITLLAIAIARTEQRLQRTAERRATELERANRELAESNRAKDTFLANMSHELRTPLNSIIGFSGILTQGLAGPLTEEQTAQIAMINRSGNHLLGLVNEILDLARIESGEIRVHIDEFDPVDILADVAETLGPLSAGKGLDLKLEAGPPGTLAVSDSAKVRQILLNLAGNAVKFTEAGQVVLTNGREPGGRVVFSVADTGPGIPADSLDEVFDPFVQVRPPGAPKPTGTGLGLAIAREYATLLGGEITAASSVGSGSEFTLTLPRIHPDHPVSSAGDRKGTAIRE